MALLGVNIDHVATIREARKTTDPSPLLAAHLCELAGAHSITVHLREDQRHIKTKDVFELKEKIQTRLNLEMSLDKKIVEVAKKVLPASCCLVPEKREELTTEGGLAIISAEKRVKKTVHQLKSKNILVSLFIDPNEKDIEMAHHCGADMVEIHTGNYANAKTTESQDKELKKIHRALKKARELDLTVNLGHGINYFNVQALAKMKEVHEFNIGHSIISRAVLVGLEKAVRDMLKLLEAPVTVVRGAPIS